MPYGAFTWNVYAAKNAVDLAIFFFKIFLFVNKRPFYADSVNASLKSSANIWLLWVQKIDFK